MYMLDNLGRNGEKYFKCMNYKMGCRGRLKSNHKGLLVSRPHTCAPSAARPRAQGPQKTAARQRKAAGVQDGPPVISGAFQPIIRPEPQRQPPVAPEMDEDDDEDMDDNDDEGVAMDQDPHVQLQMDYIRQKMEIGNLVKQKLSLQIAELQCKVRSSANPTANVANRPNSVNLITSATPARHPAAATTSLNRQPPPQSSGRRAPHVQAGLENFLLSST